MSDKQISSLAVRLYGRRIGALTRLADDHYLYSFDQAYVDENDRPAFSLSFKGSAGGLITSVRPYKGRLPPFFSNLLPEGHLRDYLAARAGVKPDRPFFLLAALGTDLPGAVSVLPEDDPHDDDDQGRGRHAPMRFSLAGLQLKLPALMETDGGLAIPADGVGGTWIVKLPSSRFEGVTENEHAMMELARRIGITVPRFKLVPISAIEALPRDILKKQGRAFAIERFDRKPDGGRIHMEDFAQVFGIHSDKKSEKRGYADIAVVLSAEAGMESAMDFARRLVFSVLIGNTDMHLKNWSLLYKDGRKATLAPAYDFISTVPYLSNDQLALDFGGDKKIDSISLDQIRRFAETVRLAVTPLWQMVQETTELTMQTWKSLEVKDEIPVAIRSTIEKHMHRTAVSIK